MTRDVTFPDAPADSYVSEEGWLICGEEAWTLHEWMAYPNRRPGYIGVPQRARRYDNDEDRKEARRRAGREHMRRKRAA